MKLDADAFFNQGYVVNKINTTIADELLAFLKTEIFQDHSGVYVQNQPPSIVSWSYQENKTPPRINDFWKNLATSEFFDLFSVNYGDFSHLKMSAHRYSKNQTLLWHHDFHEALPINNILYLSDKEVTYDDGAVLEIGRWRPDRNGWGQQKEVKKIASILPQHATLVTLFNMNPTIVHSVTPLQTNYARFSLICRMGYSENIKSSKITSLM
jgi:hypothetical protein